MTKQHRTEMLCSYVNLQCTVQCSLKDFQENAAQEISSSNDLENSEGDSKQVL